MCVYLTIHDLKKQHALKKQNKSQQGLFGIRKWSCEGMTV